MPSIPKDQSDPIPVLTTSLHSEDVDIAKGSVPESSPRKSAKLIGSLVIPDATLDVYAAPVESSVRQVCSRQVLCAEYFFFLCGCGVLSCTGGFLFHFIELYHRRR